MENTQLFQICEQLSTIYGELATDRFDTPLSERKYSDDFLAQTLYKYDLSFMFACMVSLEFLDVDTISEYHEQEIRKLFAMF
jgi:hypothetical protein